MLVDRKLELRLRLRILDALVPRVGETVSVRAEVQELTAAIRGLDLQPCDLRSDIDRLRAMDHVSRVSGGTPNARSQPHGSILSLCRFRRHVGRPNLTGFPISTARDGAVSA